MIDTTTAPASATTPLTALDRCDACGAQAYVRVQLENAEFLFCGHHATKHAEKLRPEAIHWHDETAKLYAGDGRTAPLAGDDD